MVTAKARYPVRASEALATLIIAGVGVSLGSFLGALHLINAPTGSIAPLWALVCIALMAVPIIATCGAAMQLHSGRLAIHLPLFGLGAVVALMFLIILLGISDQPKL